MVNSPESDGLPGFRLVAATRRRLADFIFHRKAVVGRDGSWVFYDWQAHVRR